MESFNKEIDTIYDYWKGHAEGAKASGWYEPENQKQMIMFIGSLGINAFNRKFSPAEADRVSGTNWLSRGHVIDWILNERKKNGGYPENTILKGEYGIFDPSIYNPDIYKNK